MAYALSLEHDSADVTKHIAAIINPGSGDGEADVIEKLLRERLRDDAVQLTRPGADITVLARHEVDAGAGAWWRSAATAP